MNKPNVADLLVELGTEELPPEALYKLAQAFAQNTFNGLLEADMLTMSDDALHIYATPRRLAFIIKQVRSNQPDQMVERKGPALAAAFDKEGNPSKAALGFAKSCGVEFDALERMETDKGTWLFYKQLQKGQDVKQILSDCLQTSIKQLPIPKRMRWGAHEVEFVRPVHWLLVLHGDSVPNIELLGLQADNKTYGHRVYAQNALCISHVDEYASTLQERGKVIADFSVRKKQITAQINDIVKNMDATVGEDEALLDIVTALVEWPKALVGDFDERFLAMPDEVLVSSMRDHQKYFHLLDSQGHLLPHFITVSNIDSSDMARVRQGNERVLRARLSDAEFFWVNDQKLPLIKRVDALQSVTFHHKLGSIADKVARISQLAQTIATQLGADATQAQQGAQLCKADLTTEMVGEFPELQGLVGYHYALNDGVSKEVAQAIMQHYWPRFAGDQLPTSAIAQSLAIADRVDSVAGIFACDEIPSGDKDPYALRRAALGALRIIIENALPLDLAQLIEQACKNVHTVAKSKMALDALTQQVRAFTFDRLRSYYQEQGFHADLIQSVMEIEATRPLQFDKRLRALQEFVTAHTSETKSLAAANKRIANILAKNASDAGELDESLLLLAQEKQLYDVYQEVNGALQNAAKSQDYQQILRQLGRLQLPLDHFFEHVMVMDDDEQLQKNRLRLLNKLRQAFLLVADISLLRLE